MANVGLLTMALKEEREEGTVYGTVREVMAKLSTKKPTLRAWSAKNVADDSKMLHLKIQDTEGKRVGINCSKPLSAMLRAKEITLTQVLDFRVVEHTVGAGYKNAGLVTPMIILPDAEEDTTTEGVLGTAKAKVAFAPEAMSLADLLQIA
jgi:hypothetical protein